MSLNKHADKHTDKLAGKYTDYAINKHQFNFDDVIGKSGVTKLENSGHKGLRLIQSIKDLFPARGCCCSQSFVPQCGSIVTNLSVYGRHGNLI